jgi:flavin-binding protein dodecin
MEEPMDDNVFKKIEIVGTSTASSDEAIQNALLKASSTVRKMRWFEVVETRGQVQDGKVAQWQVTLRVGFRLD